MVEGGDYLIIRHGTNRISLLASLKRHGDTASQRKEDTKSERKTSV